MSRSGNRTAWIVAALAIAAVVVEAPVDWGSLTGHRAVVQAATVGPGEPLSDPQGREALTPEEIAARRAARSDDRIFPLVRTPVGCVKELTVSAINSFIKKRMGPIAGWDNPQIYPLPDGRHLWMMQDSFIDDTNSARSFRDMDYLHNVAMVQDGLCFELVTRAGLDEHGRVFEPGRGRNGYYRFFWPLGGAVRGNKLRVFWAEMRQDNEAQVGIKRYPTRTWLGTYDATTLERLRFRPAPNDGVTPQWGFAVATAGRFSYLYGNDNQLNLDRVGGWAKGPHESTNTYVARVPRGKLQRDPVFWNGSDWVADPAAAVPISSRFWSDNLMHPLHIADRWVNVTKENSFWGSDIYVDVADRPQGPWVTAAKWTYQPPPFGREAIVTYHPVFLPYLDPSGRLIMIVSENSANWDIAVENIQLYRPSAVAVAMPPTVAEVQGFKSRR